MQLSRAIGCRLVPFTLCFLLAAPAVQADSLTIPHTFTANTPAKAAEVNANFAAVETSVDDNADDIAALQAAVAALQATVTTLESTVSTQANTIVSLQNDLAAVQDNSVLALDGTLNLVTDAATNQPTARFSGVNVQIVNGTDDTETRNSLGNLIVGYNEVAGAALFCSSGAYASQSSCESVGFIWGANQRTGSHNLILGQANAYSQYGGLVAGASNIINGAFSSVSGGYRNTASGGSSSVSGGYGNTASGIFSSVSGGGYNTANNGESSVSGGYYNTAGGAFSSVSGGYGNFASGDYSSVSGGASRPAPDYLDWRAGDLFQDH